VTALWVALGAVVGAPLRLLVSRAVPGPRGTFAVNVVGSFVLGTALGAGTTTYALVGIGFCGALTTFSTFALEAAESAEGRHWRRSGAYVVATLVACLGAAALGLRLG
jgi:CrcB protein